MKTGIVAVFGVAIILIIGYWPNEMEMEETSRVGISTEADSVIIIRVSDALRARQAHYRMRVAIEQIRQATRFEQICNDIRHASRIQEALQYPEEAFMRFGVDRSVVVEEYQETINRVVVSLLGVYNQPQEDKVNAGYCVMEQRNYSFGNRVEVIEMILEILETNDFVDVGKIPEELQAILR